MHFHTFCDARTYWPRFPCPVRGFNGARQFRRVLGANQFNEVFYGG